MKTAIFNAEPGLILAAQPEPLECDLQYICRHDSRFAYRAAFFHGHDILGVYSSHMYSNHATAYLLPQT